MAKRRKARARTRAKPTRRARAKPAARKAKKTIRRDGRRFSRRIEFTPRMKQEIRQRYVEAGDSPELISRIVGCAKATIQRLVNEQGWTRAGSGPRDLSRAEQLAAETRALAQADIKPVDIDEQIENLLRLVSQEIGVYKNLRAVLRNEPQPERAALKTAHILASLTSTLDDLRRMRAANKEPVQYVPDDDDIPADIDAFRDELARQIEPFMESRTDEECGLPSADQPSDGAQT